MFFEFVECRRIGEIDLRDTALATCYYGIQDNATSITTVNNVSSAHARKQQERSLGESNSGLNLGG